MDVFGHVSASLLIGRAAAPSVALRRQTTIAALAGGLLPDVDAVAYLWGAEAYRQVHQVYTHNVLALIALPVLITLALRPDEAGRAWVYGAALLGMIGHLVGDVIGLWPVPLLVPFSEARLGLSLLEQDFSIALDLVLVIAAVATFWDPIAERPARVRAVLGVGLLAAVVAVALS